MQKLGGTHGSLFFKRSLLLDIVVSKAQRQTTGSLSLQLNHNLLRESLQG